MTGHFDKNLNLRQLILDKKPKVIVEIGAGDGACTRLLAFMKHYYPFTLKVISDKKIGGLDAEFITGLSYDEIPKLEDNSLGLAIVDTDHNYWTVSTELETLRPKMEEGGLIVLHDVDTFYYDTGMGMGYWNEKPYPEKEILEQSNLGGVGLGVIDFLHRNRGEFKLVRWITEHHGCAVLEKKSVSATCVVRPGADPVFAPPKPK